MVSSNQDNDFSFLEKKDANSLSGKDIFFTILRNLHWLILCALVCGGIAYYHSDRQNRIYESHAKVRLTSVTRSRLESGISTLESITNRRVAITMNAINDEIIVLKSETPMLEVAKRLDLGTSYSYQTKLVKRQRDLYGQVRKYVRHQPAVGACHQCILHLGNDRSLRPLWSGDGRYRHPRG